MIYAISRTKTSCKFVFPQSLRDPQKHLDGVKNKMLSIDLKCEKRIPYQLKGKEVRFYINVTNGEFWFNKVPLVKTPQINKQPSDDVPMSDFDSEDDEPEVLAQPNTFSSSSNLFNKQSANKQVLPSKKVQTHDDLHPQTSRGYFEPNSNSNWCKLEQTSHHENSANQRVHGNKSVNWANEQARSKRILASHTVTQGL